VTISLRLRAAVLGLGLGAAVALAPPTARTQARVGPLQGQAEAIVSSGDDWTILAWSLDRDEPLFAVNADAIKVPASNNKVFSSILALDLLGPDYRFPTDLLMTGAVQGGVLRGDLVLRGSGDPAFGYPELEKDPLDPLRRMAAALRAQGVTSVEGGIIADATVHDDVAYGPRWPQDTGNGAAWYAPTVSGLPFQRNVVFVEAFPGGTFTTHPYVPEIPVVWKARGGRAFAVREPDEDTIQIKGSPAGRGPHRYPVGAANPTLLAPAALREALKEAGIAVRGPIKLGPTPRDAALVHRHLSIPLRDLVVFLNRDSDNFFAEHLWKAGVAKAIGQGSYAAGGSVSANFFHGRAGVPYGHLWQADGSGLSAFNQTSARAMIQALKYADRAPWSQDFHASMAVAGDSEGTLERMFNSGAAAGNLHAKTGYIRGVRSLSGYVKTRGGEDVAFAFIYNGRNTSGARGVQIQLGNLLAEFAR
jgi:D-alanyl-D-alanine carboxypeptidase/D-alanyl-D-alanine-endopeptidase (penicillin-binding protein 4)